MMQPSVKAECHETLAEACNDAAECRDGSTTPSVEMARLLFDVCDNSLTSDTQSRCR